MNGGKSPFSKGPIKNLLEFFECKCFGALQSDSKDWLNSFEIDKHVEHQPLLRHKENFQYVWSRKYHFAFEEMTDNIYGM